MTTSSLPDAESSWHESDMSDPPQPAGESITIRSEERPYVSTTRVPVTRVKVRKRIVTETRTVTIEVAREELVVKDEAIEERDADTSGPDAASAPQELVIVLHEQRPVITMETVPVERVLVRTHTVTQDQRVTETISKEQIELHTEEAGRLADSHQRN